MTKNHHVMPIGAHEVEIATVLDLLRHPGVGK